MRARSIAFVPFLLAVLAQACSSEDAATGRAPTRLAPLASPVRTTEQVTLVPTHPMAPARVVPSNVDPDARARQLAEGWGEFTDGPGEGPIASTPDGAPAPASGPARKRLVRFAHVADFQLADDESPSRLASFEGPSPLDAAFRPQEGHACRIVNAVVRTLNRVHADAPMDGMVLGGDNIDSAQTNELEWVLALLGGQSDAIACDSGEVNDPVPGPDNDGKDPFVPSGLDMPWYWVTGNHDILNQGNLTITERKIEDSVGDNPIGGTRDYRLAGAPVTRETVPADRRRIPLDRAGIMGKVIAHSGKAGPPAHGLGPYASEKHKAFYAVDLGTPGVRLLAIDTASETGGSDGILRRGDIEGFVKPELARAQADGRLVIFASHHASDKLGDGTGLGGSKQADAITGKEWEELLAANPHVIAHFAGHSHEHLIKWIAGSGNAGYWEVRTSAIMDHPGQFRMVEIWDEDNGMISIRATSIDYATNDDKVALEGRKLTFLDFTTLQLPPGLGAPKDRNVVLWRGRNGARP